MKFIQNASRCVILLHEIYGINQHIKHYAQLLYEQGYDVYVPNLIKREQPFSYEEEKAAYHHFMDNVDFFQAKLQVSAFITAIAPTYAQIKIVGFSVGATIGWLCSEHAFVEKVVGLYGSRIRQYVAVEPTAETLLIYGQQEKSFNPAHLVELLCAKQCVKIKIVAGAHGFADPYSVHYNEALTKEVIHYLTD